MNEQTLLADAPHPATKHVSVLALTDGNESGGVFELLRKAFANK